MGDEAGPVRGPRHPISIRYPDVEVFTCALFLPVTVRLQYLHELPPLAADLYLAAAGAALAFIDSTCDGCRT